MTVETLDTAQLVDRMVYIRLHGLPDQPYLYGDNWQTALSADQVRSVKLPGSLVFLEGCYGALCADAFIQAGALAVVGSDTQTYGKRLFLGPSSKIGQTWLEAINKGHTVDKALELAQAGNNWRVVGNKEARIYHDEENQLA